MYYYPIPINFIIRVVIAIKYYWDRFRSRPSRIDIQIHRGIRCHIRQFDLSVDRECDKRIAGAIRLCRCLQGVKIEH